MAEDRFRNTRQPDWDWWSRLWPAPGETLRALGLESGTSLAEIGSGNGYFALPAARVAAPATVYAVDLDGSLLAELERLADLQGLDNVVAIRSDVRELGSILPERVDACLLANMMHGVDDPGPFVEQIHETLVDDGAFVVVNWRDLPRNETPIDGEPRGPPSDLRLSPAETRRLVAEAADFAPSREVDLPPYHYGIVFRRTSAET